MRFRAYIIPCSSSGGFESCGTKSGIQHAKRQLTGSLKLRKITRRKALERWETNISNCEVIPHAIWPTTNFLMKMGGPKVPTAIHGLSGPKFHFVDKANSIADRKIGSHHTTCVTNTMNGGWRPMSKLCLKPRATPPQKESDHVTYKNYFILCS